MHSLEARLPHRFADPALLRQALTHSSAGFDLRKRIADNQRQEFLGDAVLQLVLSAKLYQLYPGEDEGLLTKLRTRLVQTGALARVARTLKLGPSIQMSRGEEANGGRERDNILADAMEAIIGAVFVDGGYQAATAFIEKLWESELASVAAAPVEHNPKGQLQEILQDHSGKPPVYEIISSEGPDHLKNFNAKVSWNGVELGQGAGKSKKEAQTAAALEAMNSTLVVALKNKLLPTVPLTSK
ncbi:ribonuclease III [Phragmitibacter flavus]|uniref:Ribonuclease 3 n=1 Tax=Phragmitibacter flavus TaxID=2576071 RepID=A0A5R8KKE3_9BACT|nr:ribonuclease III [Phragmitibacter flavus]TLD72701.1 ribonuclease III [Phragmitibacter flavus]